MGTAEPQGENLLSFVKLYTAHELRFRAFAMSLMANWADADEVLQAASIVIWQRFDRFAPGTNFFSWGCRIIHLTAKDFWKRRRRERVRFSDEVMDLVAAEVVGAESNLADRERLLAECVSKLKDRDRQMVDGRYSRGAAVEALAAEFGLTGKGVYQALSRVHLALHDCVARALRREGLA